MHTVVQMTTVLLCFLFRIYGFAMNSGDLVEKSQEFAGLFLILQGRSFGASRLNLQLFLHTRIWQLGTCKREKKRGKSTCFADWTLCSCLSSLVILVNAASAGRWNLQRCLNVFSGSLACTSSGSENVHLPLNFPAIMIWHDTIGSRLNFYFYFLNLCFYYAGKAVQLVQKRLNTAGSDVNVSFIVDGILASESTSFVILLTWVFNGFRVLSVTSNIDS